MEDIELVIKIPKEIYDYIHNEHIAMRVCDGHKVAKAIANGTPLPKGHWIDREVYDADRWKCSECGRTEQYQENFCPNCGADMREVEE